MNVSGSGSTSPVRCERKSMISDGQTSTKKQTTMTTRRVVRRFRTDCGRLYPSPEFFGDRVRRILVPLPVASSCSRFRSKESSLWRRKRSERRRATMRRELKKRSRRSGTKTPTMVRNQRKRKPIGVVWLNGPRSKRYSDLKGVERSLTLNVQKDGRLTKQPIKATTASTVTVPWRLTKYRAFNGWQIPAHRPQYSMY